MGVSYTYILRISGVDRELVAEVMGTASSQETGDWALELREGPDDPSVRFIEEFMALIADKFEPLENVGVHREDITVWLLYEYEGQCNMEFLPEHLRMLGEAGISLCVSCWEGRRH